MDYQSLLDIVLTTPSGSFIRTQALSMDLIQCAANAEISYKILL